MKAFIVTFSLFLCYNITISQEIVRHQKSNGKYVLIQSNDTTIILSREFDEMGDFKNGGIPVKTNGKWGYIASSGKFIIEPIYDKVDSWFCGEGEKFTSVMKDGKWGLIDKSGILVHPFLAEEIISFTNGFAPYLINKKYGFINNKLVVFVKPQYDLVFNIHDSLVSVQKKKKWGVINCTGKVVVPTKYDFIFEFYEGMGQVELNKKFGYLDAQGKLVIPIKYEKADSYFKNGKAKVNLDGRTFFIDKNGKELK